MDLEAQGAPRLGLRLGKRPSAINSASLFLAELVNRNEYTVKVVIVV